MSAFRFSFERGDVKSKVISISNRVDGLVNLRVIRDSFGMKNEINSSVCVQLMESSHSASR